MAFTAGTNRERRIAEIEEKVMIPDAAERHGTAGNQRRLMTAASTG